VVSWEYGNEPSGSINGREFLDKLSDSSSQNGPQCLGFENSRMQIWMCVHVAQD
jgi:hypothetical protein